MAITFYPNDKKAESYSVNREAQSESTAHASYTTAVSHVFDYKVASCPPKLFMSSFPMDDDADPNIIPVRNGLVDTVLEAYSYHRMLVIRPDDVWTAILTQFNYFVNANAEKLRGSFVEHEGNKELYVNLPAKRMDVEYFTEQILLRLEENITDPSIREWIMPDFTTTTALDKTVGAIIMMSTFQSYFSYTGGCECGLPAVTIEGEKKDWQSILRRVEKLKEYGVYTTAWYHLLRPVLRRFVKAYDDPSAAENLKFWTQVIHEDGDSGGPWITGWITGFCVFSGEGKWVGPRFTEAGIPEKFTTDDKDLDAAEFWARYMEPGYYEDELQLDGACFGTRHLQKDVAPGCVTVPVKLLDDLAPSQNCGLIAGLGAYVVSSSGNLAHSTTGQSDTIQPVASWWLYTDDDETKAARKAIEEEEIERQKQMWREFEEFMA